ncbi:hypothetical protein Tco_1166374 [Tanacetum coccineum]
MRLSSEDVKKESTDSDFDNDETHVARLMVEYSRIKKSKKFDFITEDGKHIHLTEEQINQQKKIKEEVKAKAAKRKSKGPITLKVYREDGTREIIPNFKASDLHLGEWREVMIACPNRTRKGWTTIYDPIRTRMDNIHTTKAELGINLDIHLSEQDPLDKLNDLANKKRKHADDIYNYFKANKRLKSSVQYEDHLAGTVLNELVLEIFFRRHQGPGLDDHARTFSTLLLVEVDKRNLNPLKQMRVIEQLRLILLILLPCHTCDDLWSLNDKILVSESDSSPRCARCGTPVDGPSCRGCAFLRKKFDEDLLAYCIENGIFKDFEDISEFIDDYTKRVRLFKSHSLSIKTPV